MNKKKWILVGIVVVGIAGLADLMFEGLVYQLLPGAVKELVDKVF